MAEAAKRKRRAIAVIALLAPASLGLGWMLYTWAGPSGSTRIGPVRGLLLGLAPSQARDALDTGGVDGRFRGSAMGEDFAIDWAPSGEAGDLRAARMEFHLGQLVAARLTLDPAAPQADGPGLEVSPASVLVREPTDGAVTLTWLARSCPTHADEVASHLGGR